jgi:hypothetical protein
MSNRFFIAVMGAMALVVALTQPGRAEVTVKSQDGTLELTLPNGWREIKKDGKEGAALQAAGKGARVAVREYPKADFDDLKAAATFVARRLSRKLPDVEPKTSDIKINGKPAIRMEAEGTEPNGVNKGYVITVFEDNARYIGVIVSANASAFVKQKQALERLAGQLKVGKAASPAVAPVAPAPQ